MMRAPWKILAFPAVLLAVGIGRPARAGLIVDQGNTIGNIVSNGTSTGVGESFTPTFNTISGVTVNLDVVAGRGSSTVRIDLYSGSGFNPLNRIASTPTQIISSTTLATYEFDFTAPVALTPNATYTLEVTQVAGNGYAVQYYSPPGGTSPNAMTPYAGGIFYHSDGTAHPTEDLVFAEGIATPEPPAFISAGTAVLLGLGYTWRRRRQPA